MDLRYCGFIVHMNKDLLPFQSIHNGRNVLSHRYFHSLNRSFTCLVCTHNLYHLCLNLQFTSGATTLIENLQRFEMTHKRQEQLNCLYFSLILFLSLSFFVSPFSFSLSRPLIICPNNQFCDRKTIDHIYVFLIDVCYINMIISCVRIRETVQCFALSETVDKKIHKQSKCKIE